MDIAVKNVDMSLLLQQQTVLLRLVQFDELVLMHEEINGLINFIDACVDAAFGPIKEAV